MGVCFTLPWGTSYWEVGRVSVPVWSVWSVYLRMILYCSSFCLQNAEVTDAHRQHWLCELQEIPLRDSACQASVLPTKTRSLASHNRYQGNGSWADSTQECRRQLAQAGVEAARDTLGPTLSQSQIPRALGPRMKASCLPLTLQAFQKACRTLPFK